ncbi:hypothetical protein [Bdellovibrio sp. HCB337]|uniref:hypothetical protein n=1 Tax=Bdellovibrio sp. HCB337 TaxID=3394358 RepID=UPI0039A4F32A
MGIRRLNSSFVTVLVGLTLTTLSFQNCSKARFIIDEAAKEKALGDGNVFTPGDDVSIPGRGNTPGDDANIPGSRPGDDSSTPGGGIPGNDPSMPGTRPPGNDPTMPGGMIPGNDPSMPGTRPPGMDPSVPGGSTPGSDPSKPKLTVGVTTFCPLGVPEHGAYKPFALAGESKLVFVKKDIMKSPVTTSVVCEVPKVRAQILDNRRIDISACATAVKGSTFIEAYIVEESVTSNYEKYKFNAEPVMYSSFTELRVAYAEMDDKANQAECDLVGDPLLLQLNTSSPQPIELTAPEKGVMFDLLGRRSNHEKVLTSWFATAKTENYFLVLPNSKGQVLGIDELFGDATFGPDQRYSKQGFAALAKHDENRDRVISGDDAVFPDLKLWKDENLDGIAQASELSTLDEKGVVAIDLRYDRRFSEKDQHGNMTKYKSIVVMKDDSYGLVYDLWLRYISK